MRVVSLPAKRRVLSLPAGDKEAKTEALEGKITKFGSWMRAPIPDRAKGRYQHHTNRNSTDKVRLLEGSREVEKGKPFCQEAGSYIVQRGGLATGAAAAHYKKIDIQ
ncbi:hypothetical protein Ddye_001234 [Dipteronia dyeriana]|uniref:Uncharacterized protein n=1 Tax=Dipteronia dyeriana TaxID=168575 RepID=A0AAD9XNV9_9ROSI|nr:hypothetical protein Ddye_001234 [Dipteronia dyeriana]